MEQPAALFEQSRERRHLLEQLVRMEVIQSSESKLRGFARLLWDWQAQPNVQLAHDFVEVVAVNPPDAPRAEGLAGALAGAAAEIPGHGEAKRGCRIGPGALASAAK